MKHVVAPLTAELVVSELVGARQWLGSFSRLECWQWWQWGLSTRDFVCIYLIIYVIYIFCIIRKRTTYIFPQLFKQQHINKMQSL